MKYIKRILPALLLALTMTLSSCAFLPFLLFRGGDSLQETVAFSEIEYVRPSLSEFTDSTDAAIKVITDGCSLMKAVNLINEHAMLYQNFLTMYNYAYIRTSMDMSDSFYAEEIDFFDESNAVLMEYNEKFWIAVANSKHCSTLEGFLGDDTLSDYKEFAMYSDPEFKKLAEAEAKLITEYRLLLANATIEWDGREQNVSELYASDISASDESKITEAYFKKYNPLAAEKYLELSGIRAKMAESIDYDSYLDIAAYQLGRDFPIEDAAAFIKGMREDLLPLIREIRDDKTFKTKTLKEMDPDKLMEEFDKVVAAVSPDYTEIADYMKEYGMYDVLPSLKKEDMSYTSYLYNANSPFIFVNPVGDEGDLMTLVHEFGHFTEMSITADAVASIDFAEVFSQGFEMLVLAHMADALDSETEERLSLFELNSSLSVFLYQGMYADFEYRVYTEKEELTVDLLNRIFKQVTEDWGFGNAADYYCLTWIDIPHLFLYPTYVLSYSVSLDAALQIYRAELNEAGKGIELYEALLVEAANGSDFLEALENVGLISPLKEGRTKETADFIRELYYGKETEETSLPQAA